jgi:hypothetical protein
MYYQLWHERTHSSSSARWLRECIKDVAASLRPAFTTAAQRSSAAEAPDPP